MRDTVLLLRVNLSSILGFFTNSFPGSQGAEGINHTHRFEFASLSYLAYRVIPSIKLFFSPKNGCTSAGVGALQATVQYPHV